MIKNFCIDKDQVNVTVFGYNCLTENNEEKEL